MNINILHFTLIYRHKKRSAFHNVLHSKNMFNQNLFLFKILTSGIASSIRRHVFKNAPMTIVFPNTMFAPFTHIAIF